jgi:crotonobetainyl-CoA:carnitine CoA-transferase CaiB-like acyl-CoA transferase
LNAYPQFCELRPTTDQGGHTDAVLQELGYDAVEIARIAPAGPCIN